MASWVDPTVDRHPSTRYTHRLATAVSELLRTDEIFTDFEIADGALASVLQLVRWAVVQAALELADEDREKRERSQALQAQAGGRDDFSRPASPRHDAARRTERGPGARPTDPGR